MKRRQRRDEDNIGRQEEGYNNVTMVVDISIRIRTNENLIDGNKYQKRIG